jgi:hypothetical protein
MGHAIDSDEPLEVMGYELVMVRREIEYWAFGLRAVLG